VSTTETTIADPEGPEVLASNIAVGSRLLSSAVVFLFMSFVFAFFYLRALNTSHLFREPGANPPTAWGVVVLVCVLASVAGFEFARRQLSDGTGTPWRAASAAAWVIGLAAVVVQFTQYYYLHFGATAGGLASVFFGFTAVFAVFWLGAVYWMETLWAQSVRQPKTAAGDVHSPSALMRPSADSCMIFLYTMSVVEIFAFVLLYLVK
jgi:heme/copper-type cytochrome/quinol oxidase subunit 3